MPFHVTGPGFEQLREEPQLVLEELLVAIHVVAEQGVRLGERTAAENHFGASVRERVERGEALEDAHRVVGAEHGDGGPEENARRAAGDRAEDDLGRGDREVAPMMLADAERVEPHLVGEHRFVHDVTQHVRRRVQRAPGGHRDVAERVESYAESFGLRRHEVRDATFSNF